MDFDPKKNYYEMLGIDENASEADIKKAFRQHAIKNHPDRWGDKAKFQEANEAYQVLWDKNKRSQYDAFRKWGWWFGGFWGWDFGWFSGGTSADFGDLGDLLGWMFWWWFGGFWGWRQANHRWEDLEKHIEISFDEAYLWSTKKIAYTRKVMTEWVEKKTCSTCNGQWRVSRQAQTPFGVMQTQVACDRCHGVGQIFTKNWKEIGAGGLEDKKEIIQIKIPAGIKDQVYLKYTGKGNEGIWWREAWDLYIKININNSKNFTRQWNDLYTKIPVSIFDLVLWWEHEITHPTGKVKVKIPKGTQVKDKIKISWKWFEQWWVFGKKWDMYIQLDLSIPKKLSKEDEKLRKKLKWK